MCSYVVVKKKEGKKASKKENWAAFAVTSEVSKLRMRISTTIKEKSENELTKGGWCVRVFVSWGWRVLV